MKQDSGITTKKIVLTALLAALTVTGSAIRITIPVDIAGTTSFHLGNVMCALAGLLLGPWYGGLAAAIGSAIYDLTNPLYIAESWITFLTKGALGMVTGLTVRYFLPGASDEKSAWHRFWKPAIAAAAGAITYALLYLGKSYCKGIWVNGLNHDAAVLSVVAKIPATAFNAVIPIVFAPILATAIKSALKENHLGI